MILNLLSKSVHRANPKHPADKPNQNGLFAFLRKQMANLNQFQSHWCQSWPGMVVTRADGSEACLRNAFLWKKPGLHSQQLEEERNASGVVQTKLPGNRT